MLFNFRFVVILLQQSAGMSALCLSLTSSRAVVYRSPCRVCCKQRVLHPRALILARLKLPAAGNIARCLSVGLRSDSYVFDVFVT